MTKIEPKIVPDSTISASRTRRSAPGSRASSGNTSRAEMYALYPTTSANSTLSRRTGPRSAPAPKEIPAANTTPTPSQTPVHPNRKCHPGAATVSAGRRGFGV